MANLAVTAAQVALTDPQHAETYDFQPMPDVTFAPGEAAYIDPTTGLIGKADANDAGKEQFAGVVVSIRGKGVTLLKQGRVYGYDLSGLSYFAPVYLSDDAGKLADATGTLPVLAGKVVPITEAGRRVKVLYVDADWRNVWAAEEGGG